MQRDRYPTAVKKAFLFISLLSFSGFAFTEVLTYLKGHAETDAIVIEWQSANEEGVKNFAIERSEIKSNDFEELATIATTGANSTYRYRDAAVNGMAPQGGSGGMGAKTPLADLYKYRIKINYADAVSYSNSITVTRPSSVVKRTWGMIKEMFR